MDTPRLLILDNELKMGGKEKLLYEFMVRNDPQHLRIAVCCLKEGGYYKAPLKALGIPFRDRLLTHRYDALAFRTLASFIRENRIDVMETFTHPNTVIFSLFARQRRLVSRVVISHHAIGTEYKRRVLPGYVLPLMRRVDAHIAVAEVQKRYLVEVEGIPADRIHVIYNGVDAQAYHPASAEERTQARRLLGIPDAGTVIMAVGSLKPLKGIDILLRAAAPLLRDDTRLVLVGDGTDRAALENLAVELGVRDRVTFAGLRSDVEVMLRGADILALSSHTEALPTVVIEGLATGLPVVATWVGGVVELVEPDRTALTVAPGDVAALRSALQRLVSDASLRARLGAQGRKIVEARFRIETMCQERTRLFTDLLSATSQATSG